jgi:O-antigen ligase
LSYFQNPSFAWRLLVIKKSGDSWARAVVFVVTLELTSSDLTTSLGPYIHWIVTALAIILLFFYGFMKSLQPRGAPEKFTAVGFRRGFPATVPAVLFLFAVCVPVVYGAALTPALVGLGKLAAILLAGLLMIAARVRLALSAFYGLLWAVWINFALLLIGILTGGPTGGMMAPGRWGTVLNFPGALWRLAMTAWMYAIYLMIKRFSVRYFALFLVSTILVFMDGARTALLILGFGTIYLIVILGMETGSFRKTMMTGLLGGVALVAFFGILGSNLLQREGIIARTSDTMTSVTASGSGGLEVADYARFTMLQTVLAAIQDHPVLGTGIGSTTIETPVGPMVVHMTYLQIWADLGLPGLFAYVWLVWGWLPWLPMALRRIRTLQDDQWRAIYYNAIFLLFVFGLAGLFHPLSTEWAQWLPFIVPYALLWHVVCLRPRTNEMHA